MDLKDKTIMVVAFSITIIVFTLCLIIAVIDFNSGMKGLKEEQAADKAFLLGELKSYSDDSTTSGDVLSLKESIKTDLYRQLQRNITETERFNQRLIELIKRVDEHDDEIDDLEDDVRDLE